MTKRKWKKIALWSTGVFLGLVVILAVHIWWVMRPHIDAHTRVMARIDLHQPVGRADADKITAWLYRQQGVDHVLVNPKTQIAVFTFFPVRANADSIVRRFNSELSYQGRRFVPSREAMMSGCPAMAGSMSFRVAQFFKKLF